MTAPLVSILIPAYNQAQFLPETLSSALEQDYDNLEVVIADDGSRDHSAEVINDFARRYPKRLIPIIGQNNVGVTKNYNRALKHCHGKYVALQGGDDVLLPGKVTAQVVWMEADARRALCGHDVEVFKHYIVGPSALLCAKAKAPMTRWYSGISCPAHQP